MTLAIRSRSAPRTRSALDLTSAPSNPVTPGPMPQGQWGPLQTWPIVAVHSVLMNNGKLLQWDGWQTPEPTEIYDPGTGNFTTINAPSSNFCAGKVQLPDGRIMTVGGYGTTTTGNQGLVDTDIFDPATQTWTRVANMHLPRWYPDVVELADGRYVAISGNSTSATTWADTPEVYDPTANTWTLLSNVNTSQVHEEEYPFSYLAPNGQGVHDRPVRGQSRSSSTSIIGYLGHWLAPAAWSMARRSRTSREDPRQWRRGKRDQYDVAQAGIGSASMNAANRLGNWPRRCTTRAFTHTLITLAEAASSPSAARPPATKPR